MVVWNAFYLKLFWSGQIRKQRKYLRETRDLKSFSHTSAPFSFSLEILLNMIKRIKYVALLFKQHRSTCLFALPQPVRPEMRHQMYWRIGQKRKGELVNQAENTNSNWFIHPDLPYFLLSSFFFFWRSSIGKKLNNSAALICTHKWEFISIFDFPPPFLSVRVPASRFTLVCKCAGIG